LKIFGEGGEDLLGGFLPDERLGILVPLLDPGPDVFLQGLDVLVDAALQQLGGEVGEPPLSRYVTVQA
jgi:hypothetical protein